MKHSLGWVKGIVRLKILGFLLHLESVNVMEEEKRGGGWRRASVRGHSCCLGWESEIVREDGVFTCECKWFQVSGDKRLEAYNAAHRAGCYRALIRYSARLMLAGEPVMVTCRSVEPSTGLAILICAPDIWRISLILAPWRPMMQPINCQEHCEILLLLKITSLFKYIIKCHLFLRRWIFTSQYCF